MSWLKIDDGFSENPKIDGLSDRAVRVYLDGLCYSARALTDGHLPAAAVRGFCAKRQATRRHTDELVNAGVWMVYADGYLVRDYLEYNPSAATVKERRRQRSEAGRRGAEAKWNGNSDGKRHSGRHTGSHHKNECPVPSPIDQDLVLLEDLRSQHVRDTITEGLATP